jgi:outer membrane biosynthesis protein TonB
MRWMSTLREWLTNALIALAGLVAEVRFMPRARRNGLLAGASALGIVALTATLLLTLGRAAPSQPPRARLATATATHTTVPPTHTPRPRPTATATPIPPPPVQTTVQKPLPPPPPLPPKPPAPPTATPCPTPTPAPTDTPVPPTTIPTDTPVPTTTATAAASPSAVTNNRVVTRALAGCTPCGVNAGNNPSRDAIRAALDTAADTYHLPRNLVYSVAWRESSWHQDVEACDGGVGLMQIQFYLADYFNGLPYQSCGLAATSYDIHTLQGNALLGAKVLRFLYCYYTYGASYGGLPGSPAAGSSQRYYWDAGLNYPDLTKHDANGTPNPNGLCARVYNGAASAVYAGIPSTTADPWSCPYSAQTTNDSTLLDIVLSAYNAGQGAIFNCSCIPNPGYVSSVESFIEQFAAGVLPSAP